MRRKEVVIRSDERRALVAMAALLVSAPLLLTGGATSSGLEPRKEWQRVAVHPSAGHIREVGPSY